MKETLTPLPENAPKVGDVYQHYKGDSYKVIALALHSNDQEWMIMYEPQYENPDAPFFTRPLHEWNEEVEWDGEQVIRFKRKV